MANPSDTAPFWNDLAEAPETGVFLYRKTSDGVKLRLAVWQTEHAKSTILLFPGRTEYIEKYGRVISTLCKAGYAVISVDWRGQGLSDRLDDDPILGHVVDFKDYQMDVDVLLELAQEMNLPRPWNMVAHSMGGCIGLRSLTRDLPIERAVFSAPMWGIQLPAFARPVAYLMPPLAKLIGQETRYAPGTKPVNYVLDVSFEDNMLTTDQAHFNWLRDHARANTDFAIGGPSVHWVGEAMKECKALAALPRPALPVLTFLGTLEEIVSADAIRSIHDGWSTAELRMIEGAKHEVMMEVPPLRERFLTETFAFFDREN